MCDESKYPGETNGITEDYHPLDSVYVGILVLYLIVSLWYTSGASYRNHRSTKRACCVAEKYHTFKYLPHQNFDRVFFCATSIVWYWKNLFVRVYQLISNEFIVTFNLISYSVDKLESPLTTLVYYFWLVSCLGHLRQNSTKEVTRRASRFWHESVISFALYLLNNRLYPLTKLMCWCKFLVIFSSKAIKARGANFIADLPRSHWGILIQWLADSILFS